MANDEHLQWLTEGVDAWNRRRRETPFAPDLSKADLARRSLVRYNFRGAFLSGADLHSANLQGADLEGAELPQANLYRADIRGARLERANLNRATLKRAKLDRCDLRGAQLYGADLSHARLSDADLRGADLRAWIAPAQNEPRNAFEAVFREEPAAIVTLTTAQLATASGDAATLLPDAVARPAHWEPAAPPAEKPPLKATPAAEFAWREDGRLGATRLHPTPPRPQSKQHAPIDPQARDQQLATVARLAERLASSIEAYGRDDHNRGFVAQSLGPALRTVAEETARPAEEVLIGFVRAYFAAFDRLKAEDAEALMDVDKALFDQLLVEWRRLAPFYPVLAEIDSPSNSAIAPEGAERMAAKFVYDVMDAVNSDVGREILSDETREVFEAERRKPTAAGADGEKEKLVRFAALTAALGRALDDAPRPVKRVAAFTGFALTVKELVELVAGWIF